MIFLWCYIGCIIIDDRHAEADHREYNHSVFTRYNDSVQEFDHDSFGAGC